jgi:hypothetical protein
VTPFCPRLPFPEQSSSALTARLDDMQSVLTRLIAAAREAQDSASSSGTAASVAALQQVSSLLETRLAASTDIVTDMQRVLGRVEAATASGASSAARCGQPGCVCTAWGVCGCSLWCVCSLGWGLCVCEGNVLLW